MASNPDFVEYVAEQLRDAGTIRSLENVRRIRPLLQRRDFFAVICEDQLFIKITPQGEAAFPKQPKAPPYDGAKGLLSYGGT